MSTPCLHQPSEGASAPSASRNASSKNPSGCCFQARSRVSLKMPINCSPSPSLKRRQKSPAVVRVGDAVGPEGIEVDLVVTPDFEVFQATAAGQEVVGDVQDVVALVIRHMPLEEVAVLVDVPHQADLAGQEVDGPDAAGCDAPDLFAHL